MYGCTLTNAVIFAAGMGQRLGPLTEERPKTLLPLTKDGLTLLDRMLKLLVAENVDHISVVGGYAFEVLEEHLRRFWSREIDLGRLSLILNPTYRTVNNIGSAAAAGAVLATGGLLLNSDIVFEASILSDAVGRARRSPAASFLVVDRGVDLAEEEMKVAVDESGRVTGIHKQLPFDQSIGEYIGILYLAPDAGRSMMAAVRTILDEGGTHLYYEDALAHTLNDVPVEVLDTAGRPWTEIDTAEDYARAISIHASLDECASASAAHG